MSEFSIPMSNIPSMGKFDTMSVGGKTQSDGQFTKEDIAAIFTESRDSVADLNKQYEFARSLAELATNKPALADKIKTALKDVVGEKLSELALNGPIAFRQETPGKEEGIVSQEPTHSLSISMKTDVTGTSRPCLKIVVPRDQYDQTVISPPEESSSNVYETFIGPVYVHFQEGSADRNLIGFSSFKSKVISQPATDEKTEKAIKLFEPFVDYYMNFDDAMDKTSATHKTLGVIGLLNGLVDQFFSPDYKLANSPEQLI